MVKKRVQKAKRRRSQAKATGTAAGDDDAPASEGPAPPQHVLRKLAKQQQFMQKIVVNRPVLGVRSGLKKRAKQKRKPLSPALGDLSLLSASLRAAAAEDGGKGEKRLRGLGVGGAKQRTRITDRETTRLQQVLVHPQFVADPIAAITAHLAATLPPAPPALKPARKQQQGPGSRKARQRAARQMDTA